MSTSLEPGLASIIVPVRDRARLVLRALDSAAAQSYRPLELVVVDDGSTDDTVDAVESWARERPRRDLRTRVIRQAAAGACAARNRGLDECRGEFVQFLDSDDLLDERRLSLVVPLLAAGDDYVYTGFRNGCGTCGRTLSTWIPRPSPRRPFEMLCRGEMWGNTLSLTARRGFLLSVGPWDVSLPVYQDYDYLIRLTLISDRGAALPLPLATASRTGPRISDVRETREGFESWLHGGRAMYEGLVARGAPLEDRLYDARRFRDMARRARHTAPDVAAASAAMARRLEAAPQGWAGRAERARLEARFAAVRWYWGSRHAAKVTLRAFGRGRPARTCPDCAGL